jgi:hypothetical protein
VHDVGNSEGDETNACNEKHNYTTAARIPVDTTSTQTNIAKASTNTTGAAAAAAAAVAAATTSAAKLTKPIILQTQTIGKADSSVLMSDKQ